MTIVCKNIKKLSYQGNEEVQDKLDKIRYNVQFSHKEIKTLISYLEMMNEDDDIPRILYESLCVKLEGAIQK